MFPTSNSGLNLPLHSALFGNGIDVSIALYIRAVARVFRWRDYRRDVGYKPRYEPAVTALALINTVRQKLRHVGVSFGKRVRERCFAADMF